MITNEDLLKEISQKELIDYSDLEATGQINQKVINDAINDSLSFIETFIDYPDTPTPFLKKIFIDLTILELKRKNNLLDEEDLKYKDKIENYLIKMSKGILKSSLREEKKRKTTLAFKTTKKRVDTEGFL